MVFLVGALIAAQGSGAIPILIVGVLLGWAAAPGWIELVLMWPKRVGGIAATCAEAFRPYSPVLANLTGVCYWWGWVPTCGFTAILSATALHEWYLPCIPVTPLAIARRAGLHRDQPARRARRSRASPSRSPASRRALAFLSARDPGPRRARSTTSAPSSFHLDTPFDGFFGAVTSRDGRPVPRRLRRARLRGRHLPRRRDEGPARNVPRAVFASGAMAALFFVVLPLVWLGSVGPDGHGRRAHADARPDLRAAAGRRRQGRGDLVHGRQHVPWARCSRSPARRARCPSSPRTACCRARWANRTRRDVPWVATLLTAGPGDRRARCSASRRG